MKIKDLKRIIDDLPDNMLVTAMDSEGFCRDFMIYIHSTKEVGEEYPEERLAIRTLDKELLKWLQQ